jgi:murein L,D-transpeptidase YcbB/YkuD
MAGTAPLRVELARPVPVVLFYMTAMSMPEDHALHFADDLYGHDARLTRALAMRRMR